MKLIFNSADALAWLKGACAVFTLYAATAVALPAQTFTTLYSFCSQGGCASGESPWAGLLQTTNGDLYGTAFFGGASGSNAGTVFKMAPNGTLTALYTFCPQSGCTDGGNPAGALVQATNGDLYGTTVGGGSGHGSVFKITPGGSLTTLYTFCFQTGCPDGSQPYATLVQASNGDLYGTTYYGGAMNDGAIFKITPSGELTTLYSFCSQPGCEDGENPHAALVQASDGELYGTTYSRGAHNAGTVFKIGLSGTLTTLYSFCVQSGCTDGAFPSATITQATNGDLYGTTEGGGAGTNCFYKNGCGTIFQITPSGKVSTVYNFCSQTGCMDGGATYAGVVQATNGNLYGTTREGGAVAGGTIFSLSVGLGPFVKALPTSGMVGEPIAILGTNLSGTTSVTFNGKAAAFQVNSTGTAIATEVPVGATSGTVQVVTPSGTLSSYPPFTVIP